LAHRRKLVNLTDEQRLQWMAEMRKKEEEQEAEEQRQRVQIEQARRIQEEEQDASKRDEMQGQGRETRFNADDAAKAAGGRIGSAGGAERAAGVERALASAQAALRCFKQSSEKSPARLA